MLRAAIGKIIGAFGSLAGLIVIAHWVGQTGVGLFSFLIAFLMISSTFVRFGMEGTILKKVTLWRLRQNFSICSRYYQFCILAIGLLMVVFFAPLWLLLKILTPINLETATLTVAVILNAGFLAAVFVNSAFLKALQKPGIANILETGSVSILTSLLVVGVFDGYEMVNQFVWSFFAATLFIFTVGVITIGSLFTREKLIRKLTKLDIKRFTQLSGETTYLFAATSTMTQFSQWGMVLLISPLTSLGELAAFSAAQRIAGFLQVLLMISRSYVPQKFLRLTKEKKIPSARSFFLYTNGVVFATSCIFAVLIAMFPKFCFNLFAIKNGPYDILLIFVASALYSNLVGPVGLILNITGYHKQMFRIVLVSNFFMLVTALVSLNTYGIKGAAISAAVYIFLFNSFSSYLMRREWGVNPLNLSAIVKSFEKSPTGK